jgi:hypothetical protein
MISCLCLYFTSSIFSLLLVIQFDQAVEGQAGRGQKRRGGGAVQEHDFALRLAAARAQVHFEFVLRLRHAQGRALALDGNGRCATAKKEREREKLSNSQTVNFKISKFNENINI